MNSFNNLAFVDHPVDGVTDFASCGLFDEFENPLEPLDLILSLALVFLEGSLQLFRLDSFRHLRKSGQDLSFWRNRGLSGSREEVFKHLSFGHGRLLGMYSCDGNATLGWEVPIPLPLGAERLPVAGIQLGQGILRR